jgi:hypothetical protein
MASNQFIFTPIAISIIQRRSNCPLTALDGENGSCSDFVTNLIRFIRSRGRVRVVSLAGVAKWWLIE